MVVLRLSVRKWLEFGLMVAATQTPSHRRQDQERSATSWNLMAVQKQLACSLELAGIQACAGSAHNTDQAAVPKTIAHLPIPHGRTVFAENAMHIMLVPALKICATFLEQTGIKASAVDAAPKSSMDALKPNVPSLMPIGSTTNAVSAPQHRLKAAAPTDARLT
jgi:hypothetical protein